MLSGVTQMGSPNPLLGADPPLMCTSGCIYHGSQRWDAVPWASGCVLLARLTFPYGTEPPALRLVSCFSQGDSVRSKEIVSSNSERRGDRTVVVGERRRIHFSSCYGR